MDPSLVQTRWRSRYLGQTTGSRFRQLREWGDDWGVSFRELILGARDWVDTRLTLEVGSADFDPRFWPVYMAITGHEVPEYLQNDFLEDGGPYSCGC